MDIPDRTSVSRRAYLKAAVAVGGTAGLAACLDELTQDEAPSYPAGDPDAVPERQHAWDAVLSTNEHGNRLAPRHNSLRYLNLAESTTPDEAREPLESTLSALESAFEWSPDGLLFTVGYSPTYFERFDEPLPDDVDLPAPTALTPLESPAFDDPDLLVHFASDRPDALLAAEEALFGDAETANGVQIPSLADVLESVDRRTGFVGAGLPAERQNVRGIPDSKPVPEDAPLFMGFRSGFARNQATEDRITIESGPFAGGTTQHVSKLQLQLNAWWGQENHHQRVAKMFSPDHAENDLVDGVGDNLGDDSGLTDEMTDDLVSQARERGVVGHAQKAARAREDGRPVILRRDFDTTDDDHAGLHFVSLQRSISDFVATRTAMTGTDIADGSNVGARVNNGILQYVFVRRRGNFLVAPRSARACPTPNPDTTR
ncbi:DUF7405 family protein [Haloferacaceae archaeon DSL9]